MKGKTLLVLDNRTALFGVLIPSTAKFTEQITREMPPSISRYTLKGIK